MKVWHYFTSLTYKNTEEIASWYIYIYIYFITLQRFTHQEELRNKNININLKIKIKYVIRKLLYLKQNLK